MTTDSTGAADHLTLVRSDAVSHAKGVAVIDGQVAGTYDPAPVTLFDFEAVAVRGPDDIHDALIDIAAEDPAPCVVRAIPLGPVGRRAIHPKIDPRTGEVIPPGMRPCSRHWAALDFDKVPSAGIDPLHEPEAAVAHLVLSLPPPFRAATVVWQLTASAGKRLDALYMRLWFWLSRPMSGHELTTWCRPAIDANWLDPVTCRDVQPIYVAVRIVPEGAPDPCPRRWGIVHGEVNTVTAPTVVPGVTPDHAGRFEYLDVICGDAWALAARYGNSLPAKRLQAVGKIRASIERMRAAGHGARHPTWCSECARVLGVCEFWCIDPERPLELLRDAYLGTLSPHEAAKRQRGSIEGVPAWFAGRRSGDDG